MKLSRSKKPLTPPRLPRSLPAAASSSYRRIVTNENAQVVGHHQGNSAESICWQNMKAGRKNLMRASKEDTFSLQEGQSVMQVASLRGSNVIEVMDGKGSKSLAIFPAKFQRSVWIKRGSFVVVNENEREKALESGSKIACMVLQVLFHDQVRTLEKSAGWPKLFKSTQVDDELQQANSYCQEDSDDDDGLPPLEANMNRNRPAQLNSEIESDSNSDSDIEYDTRKEMQVCNK